MPVLAFVGALLFVLLLVAYRRRHREGKQDVGLGCVLAAILIPVAIGLLVYLIAR